MFDGRVIFDVPEKVKNVKKVDFYIAQYPILRTAKMLYTLLS